MQGTANSLYDFLKSSEKRHVKLQEVKSRQVELGESRRLTSLKHTCETRYNLRHGAVHSVEGQFQAVIKTLEVIFDKDARVETTV